eukprot:2251675-Prymnesium_polylepis.1
MYSSIRSSPSGLQHRRVPVCADGLIRDRFALPAQTHGGVAWLVLVHHSLVRQARRMRAFPAAHPILVHAELFAKREH